MRALKLLLAIAPLLVFAACGGSTSNNSNSAINGNWSASLTSGVNSSPVLAFNTTLQSNGGGNIVGANLAFTTATPCFGAGTTETGTITASGNFNGAVTSAVQLTISWLPPGTTVPNVLTLNGALNNNLIAGTWTLTGFTIGCTGSGNFTMTHF